MIRSQQNCFFRCSSRPFPNWVKIRMRVPKLLPQKNFQKLNLKLARCRHFCKLEARHPSIDEEQAAEFLKIVLIGTLLSGANGAWAVSDEFNWIQPDYKFTQIEDFLTRVWEGKP